MANKSRNVGKLYDKIFTLREMLIDVVDFSKEISNEAEPFGGELYRVLGGQINNGLIPTLQSCIDKNSPFSAEALIAFMDSVPLAWTRGEQDDFVSNVNPVSPVQPTYYTAPQQPTSAMLDNEEDSQENTPIRQESAQRNKKPSLREAFVAHEKEPDFGDKLDFRKVAENYKRPEPAVAKERTYGEDKIFNQYLESSAKPDEIKRLDEDILAGAYKVPSEEEVHSMDDWRSMVDDHVDKGQTADEFAESLVKVTSGATAPQPLKEAQGAPTNVLGGVQPLEGDVMSDILNFNGELA